MEKRILDEATRKLLHSVAPFSSASSIKFTPAFCEVLPENIRPVYILRGFTVEEGAEMDELLESAAASKLEKWNQKAFALCRKVIIGWGNVFDIGSGEEVSYVPDPAGGIDKTLWAQHPINIKSALFTKAMNLHGLMDIEKLGLASSPQSTLT